jgi:hypothetical protein
MLKRNRGGINNLLINRLRRHANLATLFRSMDTPPPARYQPTRTVAIPAYVVPEPTASIEQPPLTSTAKQEEGVKTADAMEQTTWRRLQAIYRAHEQKSDSAPEGAEPGPVKQIQSPGPGHLQRKTVETAPQAKPPLPKIAGERADMGLESAQQAPDASDLAEQVTDYADIVPAGEAAPSQPVPLQPQPLQAAWPVQPMRPDPGLKLGLEYHGEPVVEPKVEPGTRPEAAPEAPALDHSRMQDVVEQISSSMPSSSSVEQIPPRRPRPQPILTPEASPPTGEEFEAGRSDTYEAPTPESAAEPEAVQRAETSVDRAEAAETASAETVAPIQDPGPEPPQAAPPVERSADAPVPDAPGELPAPTHTSPGDASTAQQSQPSQPFQAPPDAPAASIQRQFNPQAGDESARFKKPEGASIGVRPAAPAFIPTELGPLPADLWDLLGQPRPAPEMGRFPSGGPTQLAESGVPDQGPEGGDSPDAGRRMETLPASQALVQRSFHAEVAAPSQMAPESGRKTSPAGTLTGRAETPPPSLSGAAPAPMFEQIQRRPAEFGEAPPPAQAEPSGSGTETGQGGEVNLDELARRVYAEVRARLAVEWERLRR